MNLSFIKLDINIMNDAKTKIIRKMPDGDKILVLWIGILCLGMQSGKPGILEIGDGISFSADTLSSELEIPVNTVKLGLQTFENLKMIEFFDNQAIYITNFEKHQELEKIELGREKLRLRVKKSREKKKQLLLSNDHVTVTDRSCNATDLDIDQDIDKEEDIDIDQEFDVFWNEYDKKVDRVKSEKCWNKLSSKDQQDIIAYIPKYKVSQPDKQFRKNPLTFFHNRSWENEIINKQKTSQTADNYFKAKEALGIK